MPDVIAQVTLVAGGVYHPPGSIVAIPTHKEASDLVARGFAEWAGEEAADDLLVAGTVAAGADVDYGGEGEIATGLPDSFPGADALRAAGFEDVADVPRTLDELLGIDGIGKATARKILAALET